MEEQIKLQLINVLLKGEKLSNKNNNDEFANAQDEYLQEFAQKSLKATIIPPLQIEYKNIEKLKDILIELTLVVEKSQQLIGLIVSSPRVVEAISRAFNCQKTANDLKSKLSIDYNCDAIITGDATKLAEFIKVTCNNNKSMTKNNIKLIYPKGSLASQTIEEQLSKCSNLSIDPIIVYETRIIDNLCDTIIDRLLQDYSISTANIINFIFFSPSAVRGFKVEFKKLKAFLEQNNVEIVFSSIGQTTEKALCNNGFEILCVAEQPNAKSLVDCLVKDCCLNKLIDKI